MVLSISNRERRESINKFNKVPNEILKPNGTHCHYFIHHRPNNQNIKLNVQNFIETLPNECCYGQKQISENCHLLDTKNLTSLIRYETNYELSLGKKGSDANDDNVNLLSRPTTAQGEPRIHRYICIRAVSTRPLALDQ